ncbi:MAG: amino acid adenylation domain-containing protein [Polyangiales bacterium]
MREAVRPIGSRGESQAKTLGDALVEAARARPEAVAFRFLADGERTERVRTNAELHARARAIAASLLAIASPGDRVLLLLEPGLEYVDSLFGCFLGGLIAIPAFPIGTRRAHPRLVAMVADARANAVLGRSLGAGAALPLLETLPRLDPAEVPPAPEGFRLPEVAAEAIAVLQYTSGSTSEPKGVVLGHRHLLSNARGIAHACRIDDADGPTVTWLPPWHDMGLVGGLLVPFLAGHEAVVMSPAHFTARPMRWLEAIARYRAFGSGAPDFAYALVAARATPEEIARLDLSTWRVAFDGAERVRPRTLARFVSTFAEAGFRETALGPCYGLAEATLAVTFGDDRVPPARLSVDARALLAGRVVPSDDVGATTLAGSGRPLEGTAVRIVDPETCREAEAGRVGEIWVRGPGVAFGYVDRPEATRETFGARLAEDVSGETFLRTGDLGFLHEGELFVTGRIKELLVLEGQNHHPEDIEPSVEAAHASLVVGGSVVFAVDDGHRERLVVVAEARARRDVEASAVLAAIRDRVARDRELEVHDALLVLPGSIPRTSSGKRQRALVRRRYLEGTLEPWARLELRIPSAPSDPARSELEAKVARAMAEVLGLTTVERDESFLALGGTSLLVARLARRLAEVLGHEVPMRLVFEAPSPAGLAEAIAAREARPVLPPVTPGEGGTEAPLTFSQERMWLVHALEPTSSAYHVAGALSLRGALDVAALERALDRVLARHDALRTRIRLVDGHPRQSVVPHEPFRLAFVDHRGEVDPEASSQARLGQLARAPFDLGESPVYRIELERLADDRHVLAFVAHHVLVDGYAVDRIQEEVLDAYAKLVRGEPVETLPPPISYLDYAAHQRRYLVDEVLRPQLEHFREALFGLPPLLELPTDRPRPPRTRSEGDLVIVPLPEATLAVVDALARRHGLTPFMVLLAAFDVMLGRYAGTTDVAVGTPVANRRDRESETLVGTLVNTLVLRTDLSGGPTFLEVLGRVRETCLGAYANQDVPFERLVAELATSHALDHAPLVQVMFDHQTIRLPHGSIAGLEVEGRPMERRGAQFDLACSIANMGRETLASFEYRIDLFERATIERFARGYLALLEAAANDPSTPIAALPVQDPADRELALACGRGRRRPYAYELAHRAVEARAAEHPQAIAIVHGETKLTYGELEARVRTLASLFARARVRPGARVAVCLGRDPDLVASLLAIWRLGAAYVPLDPANPAERTALVLEDAEPSLLVTTRGLVGALPETTAKTLLLDEPSVSRPESIPPEPPAEAPRDAIAYVIFTSGSTGRPKGVEVSHRGLANFLQSMAEHPGLGRLDRVLALTTLSFDIAGLELFLPLTVGASLELVDRDVATEARLLLERVADPAITVLQATPSTFRMLLDAGLPRRNDLRILVGGEALPPDLGAALVERAGAVFNVYGPTETTIWSTLDPLVRGGPITLGRPIDNTDVVVVDDSLSCLPMGVWGELVIGGDGVARGYLGRPELTSERFVPDPFAPKPGARMYRTGDRVRMRNDGRLEFGGRFDHQVKIRGHRIELGEVEARLAELPDVARAVAAVREVRPGDARLVAYCVPREGASLEPASIRAALKAVLPEPMVPSHVVSLDALPMTPNGKVDRKALPAPLASGADARTHVAPRDALERELVAIFEDVLATRPIGVTTSFFDLGGHSLVALAVTSRIERRLGVRVPLRALFDAPTIEELARVVADARVESARGVVFLSAGRSGRAIAVVGGVAHDARHGERLARLLASVLEPSVPLLFLPPPATAYLDLESLAAYHVRQLSLAAPAGLRALVGVGLGGNVAHEIAGQLGSRGEEPDDVFLVDARPAPSASPLSLLDAGYLGSVARDLPRWTFHVARLAPDERRRFLGSRAAYVEDRLARLLGRKPPSAPHPRIEGHVGHDPDVAGYRDLPSPYYDAWLAHRPRLVAARVHVHRSQHRGLEPVGHDLGWTRFCLAPPRIVVLHGSDEEARIAETARAIAVELRATVVDRGDAAE